MMLAFASALEPTRMGIAALVVALPRPILNLFAYWIGLFAAGIGFYLAGLFVLCDYIAPIVVVVQSATASPVVPLIKIALGLLAISLVTMIVVRSRVRRAATAPVPVTIGGPSGLELQPENRPGSLRCRCRGSRGPGASKAGRLSWLSSLDWQPRRHPSNSSAPC